MLNNKGLFLEVVENDEFHSLTIYQGALILNFMNTINSREALALPGKQKVFHKTSYQIYQECLITRL